MLRLAGLSFQAAVCTEANPAGTGSEVSDLALLNLDRMLWVEISTEGRRLSFQIEAQSWLVLTFVDERDFDRAARQLHPVEAV